MERPGHYGDAPSDRIRDVRGNKGSRRLTLDRFIGSVGSPGFLPGEPATKPLRSCAQRPVAHSCQNKIRSHCCDVDSLNEPGTKTRLGHQYLPELALRNPSWRGDK